MIRADIRWASLLLGFISLVFAAESDWYLLHVSWLGWQFGCAATLVAGSIICRRTLLHIGLGLSAFTWLSITLALASELEPADALLFPVYGFFSLLLLIDDTRRRPCA